MDFNRQQCKAMRRALSPSEQLWAAQSVLAHLQKMPEFLNAKTIAAYCAFDAELDPALIINEAFLQKKAVCLPVITAAEKHRMHFFSYSRDEALIANAYGISEPSTAHKTPVSLGAIDIVLVPMLAFDTNKNRGGYGGGYYDRVLGGCEGRPLCIGLAYDFQEQSVLTPGTWDVPMDRIVTPVGVF
jgi:5-formyltetrahydrofolate cyclo-ligase